VDFLVQARAQDTDTDGDGIKDVADTDDANDEMPDDYADWEASLDPAEVIVHANYFIQHLIKKYEKSTN
jgi:hypothetical protein